MGVYKKHTMRIWIKFRSLEGAVISIEFTTFWIIKRILNPLSSALSSVLDSLLTLLTLLSTLVSRR